MNHNESIEDWPEEEYQDDGFEAYVAKELEQNFAADEWDQIELNCVACLHDMMGDDMMLQSDCCANFVQEGLTALYAPKGGYGKGQGKAGGKGAGKGRYPIRPSNLTIEDRRKKLAELKAKSECKACGRKGHWRGDKQCTMTKEVRLSIR